MPQALIWGASGGIGGALLTLLASGGWRVFAAARDETKIAEGAALTLPFSAGDPYSFQQAAYTLGQEAAELDLVVYAAGMMRAATLEQIDSKAWQQVFDANLTGARHAIAASLPLTKAGGHLMAVGAYVDKLGLPRFGAYAAAKAGLEPLMTIFAKENRQHKFTLVRPGAVDTPFWRNIPFPLPKGAMSPQAVAQAILTRWESGEIGTLDL